MPVMNAQFPHLRQQYAFPHYGGVGMGGQQQPPNAMPPQQPPQLPGPGAQTGNEDGSSVATGEGSSEAGPLPLQQQQQQHQPYMPGYATMPPGTYPGYFGGAMMHPQARPGPGFHPQMVGNPQMQVIGFVDAFVFLMLSFFIGKYEKISHCSVYSPL